MQTNFLNQIQKLSLGSGYEIPNLDFRENNYKKAENFPAFLL